MGNETEECVHIESQQRQHSNGEKRDQTKVKGDSDARSKMKECERSSFSISRKGMM